MDASTRKDLVELFRPVEGGIPGGCVSIAFSSEASLSVSAYEILSLTAVVSIDGSGPSGSALSPARQSEPPTSQSEPEYESEVRFIPSYWLVGGLGPPV
jgi:hypothetical protein